MYYYTKSTRFCPNTGKQVDPILTKSWKAFICDMTGVLYDTNDNDTQVRCYSLSLDYNHDSEPCWYEEYHRFAKEFGIEYGEFSQFMESPFHFANTEDYGSADLSEQLMTEWVKARQPKCVKPREPKKKVRFSECATIEQVLSELRFEMLRKLLEERKFTLEELGFTPNKE